MSPERKADPPIAVEPSAALDASIRRGVADAEAGRTKPADEVFARLERKYRDLAGCNARAAYEAAGKSKGSACSHRRRWPGFERRWAAAEEQGYWRLEDELVERGANLFSSAELPPDSPMPRMTIDQALQLLRLPPLPGAGDRQGTRAAAATNVRRGAGQRPQEMSGDRPEPGAVLSPAAGSARSWPEASGPGPAGFGFVGPAPRLRKFSPEAMIGRWARSFPGPPIKYIVSLFSIHCRLCRFVGEQT
jgi:hypothetical protein